MTGYKVSYNRLLEKRLNLDSLHNYDLYNTQNIPICSNRLNGFLAEPTRRALSALPDKAQAAYHHLRENPGSNAHDLEGALGVSEATAKRLAGQLMDVGLIERQGSKKTGGYFPVGGEKEPMRYLAHCADCELYRKANKLIVQES